MPEDASELNETGMPYEAFDRMPAELLEIGGARVRVAFGPGRFAVSHARIIGSVRQSAHSVARYFGRFPARSSRVLILNTDRPGRPIRSGTAFGYRGAAIKLTLAENVNTTDLDRDWILVHEICHLAMPSLPRSHHWLQK